MKYVTTLLSIEHDHPLIIRQKIDVVIDTTPLNDIDTFIHALQPPAVQQSIPLPRRPPASRNVTSVIEIGQGYLTVRHVRFTFLDDRRNKVQLHTKVRTFSNINVNN